MENDRNQQSELKNKSWADIFNDFLNSPPTSSIFRLYLLSFCIWNKGIILYILLGSADMGEKLAFINWSKFVPFYDPIDYIYYAYSSLYLGPLIIVILIFILVFGIKITVFGIKITVFGFNIKEIPSLYYIVYHKHVEAEKTKLNDEKEVTEMKTELIAKQLKNKASQQELTLIKEQSKPPEINSTGENYEESYKKFRKTSFFTYFIGRYVNVYYDKKNNFSYADLMNNFRHELVQFLLSDECFSHIGTNKVASMETLNEPNNDRLKFNNKGEYYIKYFEWENETLFSEKK